MISYEACSLGQGNGVLAQFHSLQAVGEGHIDKFIVLGFFGGDGEGKGKERVLGGVSAMAEGALCLLLDLYAVVADGVFEVDVVELGEVQVQFLEEALDQLARGRGTGSHIVNSKLAN
jgi:hypothetical protein